MAGDVLDCVDEPVCACGHVEDEHEDTGFQRCTAQAYEDLEPYDCPCIAYDPTPAAEEARHA